MGDLQALFDSGVSVNGSLREVHLFPTGDLSFLGDFLGHKGATCRHPCMFCHVVGRPEMGSTELLAVCGSMQDVAASPTSLRSTAELQVAAVSFADGPNDTLPIPVPAAEHRSIERCPVFDVEPRQIVPAPLHLTLGITGHALRLGIEAVVFESGAAAGAKAARAVGVALLVSARVCPVPHHGGGFEGRDCHRIAQRSAAVCDALVGHLSAARLTTLRRAWAEWSKVISVLNRAEDVPVANAPVFQTTVSRFASGLRATSPWMSVTPKLHALVHHAPTFLLRFGSLGSYAEQALEAWHGFFNHARAHCTADSFLGSCLRLVERAVRERQPAAAHMLNNGRLPRPGRGPQGSPATGVCGKTSRRHGAQLWGSRRSWLRWRLGQREWPRRPLSPSARTTIVWTKLQPLRRRRRRRRRPPRRRRMPPRRRRPPPR